MPRDQTTFNKTNPCKDISGSMKNLAGDARCQTSVSLKERFDKLLL